MQSLRGRPKDAHTPFSQGACTQGWCRESTDALKETAREKREGQVDEKRKLSPGRISAAGASLPAPHQGKAMLDCKFLFLICV